MEITTCTLFYTFASGMRQILNFLFLYLLFPVFGISQTDSLINQPDSLPVDSFPVTVSVTNPSLNDSLIKNIADSVMLSDSLSKADSIRIADSLQAATSSKTKTFTNDHLREGERRIADEKDSLFYYIVFLLLFFGLVRRLFSKYFSDFFRVFFRTTLKQRQLGEQLVQAALPSLVLNFFFVITTGLYINLMLIHFDLSVTDNFWLQYLYCSAALAVIYLIKFAGLQVTGFIFNVHKATDEYTFIVFSVNKVIGMFLLPVLLFLSFSTGNIYLLSFYLSIAGIGLLFFYRFIMAFRAVRKEIRLNPFHFILYVLAFEIVPLLLIYKLLLEIF